MNKNKEILFAFLHFSLIIIPIIYLKFGKNISLIFILSAGLPLIIADYLLEKFPDVRQTINRIFYESLSNEKFPSKISWIIIAIFFNFLIFKKEIAVTSLLLFALSVPVREVVDRNFIDEKKFFENSRVTSIIFLTTNILVLLGCGLTFKMGWWFYFFGIFTITCITILRARPSLLDANKDLITIVGFSAILSFFDIIWNVNY
jgi:hypothetical protein